MAKEVIISTLGILYLGSQTFLNQLTISIHADPTITPLVAITYMVFILLYIPCLPTIGIIRSETNKKFALFVILYTFSVAYIMAFVIHGIGNLITVF